MQFLMAKNMFIISIENKGLENSYQPIPRFVCNIEALIPRDLCFYILGSWLVTITN